MPSAKSRRPPPASAWPTADLFPKFSITGTAGLESISASDFFFGTSRMWQVGPSMTWPIFEAGRIRANIEVRNAQEEQALLNYRKTVLNALAEVEDALVAYAKERTRHQALAASAQDFKRSSYLRTNVTRRVMPAISTCLRRSDRSTRRRTHWHRAISK